MATTAKKKKSKSSASVGAKKSSSGSTKRSSSGSAKRSAGKNGKHRDTKRVAARKRSFVRSESAAVIVIAAGIILLLANLGLLGALGGWLLGLERGLLGQASFLLPFAVAGVAAIAYMESGSYLRPHKIISVLAGLILISAVCHLMFGGDLLTGKGSSAPAAGELYRMCSEGHEGGGLIGGLIANTLKGILGYAGAYLVLIALLVICVVVITEKSFINAAKIGAEKTAVAVRTGAGKTLDAAKNGRDIAVQRHRENVIRRDMQREAQRLRKLEESFEPIQDSRHLSAVTLGEEAATPDADMYATLGRGIIGDEQPGLDNLQNVREPFLKAKVDIRPANEDMNFDTQVIRDVFRPGEKKPAAAVHVKQIDYDPDDVPFEEEQDEVYRSYAHVLGQGQVGIDTARMAGFAVGHSGSLRYPDRTESAPVYEPQFFDAFRPAPEGENMLEEPFAEAGVYEPADVRDDIADNVNEGFSAEDVKAASEELNQELEASGIHDSWSRGTPSGMPGDGQAPADDTPGPAEEAYDTEPDIPEPEDSVYVGQHTMPASFETVPASGEDDHEEDELSDAEKAWLDSNGKDMEAPDPYEAARIMAEKRADREKAEASSGNTGGTYAQKRENPEKRAAQAQAAPAPGQIANTNAQDAKRQPQTAVSQPLPKPKPYVFPPNTLLERGVNDNRNGREEAMQNAGKLEQVLKDFGVGVTVTAVTRGPRVSRYEMTPDTGVKVSRITSLEGDIKLALAAREIRIEAPIPGKSAVGIEVPNEKSQTVKFRDILESEEFKTAKSKLSWGIGLDIQGKPVIGNIAKMPHLLVAGTTGSGKSVGINSLIMSILYRSTPDEVRMILIDPKVVELSVYNGIPHLLTDVVTKPEKAVSALNWAVSEMNNRYKLFQTSGTRNISGYNDKVAEVNAELDRREAAGEEITENRPKKLPFILIVIDELAELMMHSKKDIESSIVSLTQLARAAGIHLVVATQRPSVDVITGLIKSNIPSRIAYRLPSQMDSRTILDTGGAETLLGNGDMLYKPGDKNSPERIQGAFLSDNEVEAVVEFLRKNNQSANDQEVEAAIAQQLPGSEGDISGQNQESQKSDRDEYFEDAGRLIITSGKASIGALQRKFKIGFNRAARIMDELHELGVVSDNDGTKERQILMTMEEFENALGG